MEAHAEGIPEPGATEKRVVGTLVKGLFLRGRRGREWPAPPETQPVSFRGNSGARLAALHLPTPEARGLVVLAHPDRRYGKHWFVREGWLPWLASNGYAALTFDFAAYGQSRGGSTYFHDDVLAAVEQARGLHPGLPLHVVGLSIGAFAVANASPRLDAESLVLESPYPTFADWYGEAGGTLLPRVNAAMAKVWPRTARRIDAGRNIASARAKRILVAATPEDRVTPLPLSRRVADAAPPERTTWLEVRGGAHLELFRSPAYRTALLQTWDPEASPPGLEADSSIQPVTQRFPSS